MSCSKKAIRATGCGSTAHTLTLLCCNWQQTHFIAYENENGKFATVLNHNPFNFSEDAVDLDASFPSLGGPVSIDWMRSAAFGATTAPGLPEMTTGLRFPLLACPACGHPEVKHSRILLALVPFMNGKRCWDGGLSNCTKWDRKAQDCTECHNWSIGSQDMTIRKMNLTISDDDDGVGYLALPGHPGPGTPRAVAKQVKLKDLVIYGGADIHLDFDKDGNLIGLEILV